MSDELRVGDQVEVYEAAPLIFDGCVGFIRSYRFVEAKWFARPPINKARKDMSRKAARKMRRKWHG